MRAITKRFPWTVRFLGLAATLLLLGSQRSWSQTSGELCGPTGNEMLQADSYRYQPDQTVQVTGTGYAPSCSLAIRVTRPDGGADNTLATTDPDGNLSFSYLLGTAQGEYTVGTFLNGDDTLPWTLTTFTNGAYVEPDMPDYAPGNRVTLTGAGWQPGESITIVIDEMDGPDQGMTCLAVADAAGNFSNDDFFTDLQDMGVHFRATATGQSSGYSAQTTFEDAYTATSRATGSWSGDATWSITRPGTISWTNGSNAITGSGTGGQDFNTDLAVGNVITTTTDATVIGTIASITDATHATLTTNVTLATLSNQTYKARRVPAGTDDVIVQRVSGGQNLVVTLDVDASANTLMINGSGPATGGSGALTFAGTQTLGVAGAVTLTAGAGSNGGTAYLNINAGTLNAGSLITGANSGQITLTTGILNVTGNAAVTAGGSTGATVLLRLNSGQFLVGGNLTVGPGTSSAQITSAAADGSIEVTGNVAINGVGGLIDVGPAALTAGGSLTLTGGGNGAATARLLISTGTATIGGNVINGGGAGTKIITFSGAGTLYVGGNLASGFSLANYATAPGSTIEFNGSGNGTIAAYTFQNLTVSKTGTGVATLAGNAIVNGALSVSSGTFDQGASFNVTTGSSNGGITISSGAKYRDVGTGDLTLGDNPLGDEVANAGTIQLNGTTAACGEADAILIRSTVNGTQRSWSGAAPLTSRTSTSRTRRGTAPITALSSTVPASPNNGANWTILGACDTAAPETTITSQPTDPTSSTSATFTFTGTDDTTPTGSLTFECQLDGGGFAACLSSTTYPGPLSAGSHTFEVRAKDAANNVDPTPASYTWTICTPTTWYQDSDGDGYGNSAATTQACTAPAGYVANSTDCNDADAAVHPGATEVCNGVDDNCDGSIDEGVTTTFYQDADGDGYGNLAMTTQACTAPAGYVANSTDCNDADAAVHPGATEVCNGVDDNCDGSIDEGVTTTFYQDADGDGYGNLAMTTQACTAPAGYVANSTDCNDADAAVHPGATEVCNGVDDNCNGTIDEGVTTTFYQDADGDGYGNLAMTTQACTAPAGYVANSTDCNDADAAVHPGATEVCNGVDDNCDGTIDEGVKTTFYQDSDGDGYGNWPRRRKPVRLLPVTWPTARTATTRTRRCIRERLRSATGSTTTATARLTKV